MNTINDTQHQDWTTYLLDRPSSPFDHRASFIPFPPSVPDEVSMLSGSFDNLVMPIRERGPSMLPSTAYTHKYNDKTKQAYRCLARAMDYCQIGSGDRAVDLVRADALTCIEKLTMGRAVTKRPRDVQGGQVGQKLQALIPEKYLTSCCEPLEQHTEEGWICEADTLARAAAKYITNLKLHNTMVAKKRKMRQYALVDNATNNSNVVDMQSKAEKELVTETLGRVEAWCDDWLMGRTEDTDWEKMEKCLST